jgi:ABC-type branched-subunit amino acid transport system substrate-binding protein
VKIISIFPTGTTEANFPEALAGVRAGVRGVNARGGINGHELVVDYCNENNNAADAQACATKAVDPANKYVAVVGMFTRQTGTMAIYEKANMPVIGSVGVGPDESTSKASFLLTAGLANFAVLPASCQKQGAKRVGMVRFNVDASKITEQFSQAGAKALGLEWAGTVVVEPTNADYAPVAAQIKDEKADCVVMSLTEQATVAFVQAYGPDQTFFSHADAGLSAANAKTLPGLKWAGAGQIPPLTSSTTDFPDLVTFTKEMDDFYKSSDEGHEDADPALRKASTSALSWLAVQAFEQVAPKVTGDLTPAAMTDQLNKTNDLELGLIPKIDYTAPPLVPTTRFFNGNSYLLTWDGTNFVIVDKTPVNAGELLLKAAG